jgi:hypothetical protein
MANSDPYPIFFKPVKEIVRSTLATAGLSDMDISFNKIERVGQDSASVIISHQIPPVMNRTGEKLARKPFQWKDSAGKTRDRVYCADMIVHFDVNIMASSVERVMGFFYGFVRSFPRATVDGHRLADPLAPEYAEMKGNAIELSIITPIFPDDTVVTAKDYRVFFIVRAEGGIWFDSPPWVSVTPKTTLAPNLLH